MFEMLILIIYFGTLAVLLASMVKPEILQYKKVHYFLAAAGTLLGTVYLITLVFEGSVFSFLFAVLWFFVAYRSLRWLGYVK